MQQVMLKVPHCGGIRPLAELRLATVRPLTFSSRNTDTRHPSESVAVQLTKHALSSSLESLSTWEYSLVRRTETRRSFTASMQVWPVETVELMFGNSAFDLEFSRSGISPGFQCVQSTEVRDGSHWPKFVVEIEQELQ